MPHWILWGGRFLFQWMHFTFRGAAASMFGWASIPAGAILAGLIAYFKLQKNANPQWNEILLYALMGASIAWVLGFLAYLFLIAPFKAYRELKPLKLTIDDRGRGPEFIHTAIARGYNVSLVIKNRSASHLIDCNVHFEGIEGVEEQNFPRFVDKFDLPPGLTKHEVIACWFARNAPHCDDNTIGISGPVGAGCGGNVLRVPIGEYIATLRVHAGDDRMTRLKIRIWIETENRRLRGQLIN